MKQEEGKWKYCVNGTAKNSPLLFVFGKKVSRTFCLILRKNQDGAVHSPQLTCCIKLFLSFYEGGTQDDIICAESTFYYSVLIKCSQQVSFLKLKHIQIKNIWNISTFHLAKEMLFKRSHVIVRIWFGVAVCTGVMLCFTCPLSVYYV